MKIFFTMLGLCIAGILAEVTEAEKSNSDDHINDCMKETGIDPAAVEKIAHRHIIENDNKQDCFSACMAKKKGLMNSDGSINESKLDIRSSVNKERAVVIINKCKVMKGADDCETAQKVINCLYQEGGW